MQPLGNDDVLINRLQICEIGNARAFASSFKNIPVRLSIPEAFFVSRFLSVFKIESEDTFVNSSFSWSKLKEEEYLSTDLMSNLLVGQGSLFTKFDASVE